MASQHALRTSRIPSPLGGVSRIVRRGNHSRKSTTATLLLTSLVDAFAILVIFLLMNSATESSDISASNEIKLPVSTLSEISGKSTTLHIRDGQYFIDDSAVGVMDLAERLKAVRGESQALLIVADRDMDYARLNPVIVSSSRAGFTELKFAVQRQE